MPCCGARLSPPACGIGAPISNSRATRWAPVSGPPRGARCRPQRGAVADFWRGSRDGWQGHVCFIAAKDTGAYHVLGGNQADAVTITRIAKTRLLETRWPAGSPEANQIRVVDARGNLSIKEA